MMELFLRGWSVLQVVAIVICIQRNVLSERVQGCVESQLNLRCPEMKVIKVTAVVLGDSNCRGTSCCITDSDCTRNANANHRAYVNSTCDNKESCTVAVLREKIPCGYWGVWYNNDFERITYICIDDPQRSTTARVSRPASTVHMLRTSERKIEYGWTAATFSRPDSTEDILSTKNSPTEKETENGVTTTPTDVQTSEAPDQNGGEHDERSTHEDLPNNSWSAAVTFSKPDSTEDIFHTEENPHQKETENDDTTKSTDIQSKEGSEQNVSINDETTTSIDSRKEQGVDQDTDGHDQNVTHEDNAHDTTTSSDVEKREGSQDKHGPNEKRPYNSYNTTSSIAVKAAIEVKNKAALQDQNINGRHEKRVHDEHSGNSWSATATFSRPDSTENIFRTEEEHPVEEETENGDTTTSTDSPNDQVSDRYVDGHNENVIHEDNTQRVQGCVGSQLSLRCPETKVIKVTALVLGDSACRGTSCCIKDSDCTRTANSIQIADVRSRCDNKQSCTVGVLQAKIPCGYLGLRMNNDFEQITYICNVQSDTTTSTDSPNDQGSDRYVDGYDENVTQEDNTHDATTSSDEEKREGSRDKHGPNEKQPYNSYNTTSSIAAKAAAEVKNKALQDQNINGRHEKRVHDEHSGNSWFVPVVMPTVCILVLIAIVAAVAMMRRKRWAKGSGAVELTEINGTIRNGEIHANEKQTMVSLNNGNESSNHGNDMMKNSRDTGATASETCEIPDNVFGSFADGAGSRPTEDPTLFKSRDYQPISYQDQHQTFAA